MRGALSTLCLLALGLCVVGPARAGVAVDRAPLGAPEPLLSSALHEEIVLVRREMDARFRALVEEVQPDARDALRALLRHPELTAALDQALRGRSSGPLARGLRGHPQTLRSLVFRIALRMPSIVPRIESIRARSRAQLEELLLPHPSQTRVAARALLESLGTDPSGERRARAAPLRRER
jgi:hypothetical protein